MDSAQQLSILTACRPWHNGAGHFLTVYMCNDYWSLIDPLRDLPHFPFGMQSKLHTALSESFRARNLPLSTLYQYKQSPRIAIQQDAPRPAWLCGTISMCTTLHLLLGVRHTHELRELYITITHMLTLHRALLEWLITGTPPTLWQLECLHQDMHPLAWPTPAPTLCLAFLRPRRSPRTNLGDQSGRDLSNPHRPHNRLPRRIMSHKSPRLRYPLLPPPPVTLPTPELYKRHKVSPRCGLRYRRPPTQHSRTCGSQNYHHHLLLLRGITDLLEERRRRGFRTTLHKIWARTNIRGNDLADAATKMAVTQYDSPPESQKLKADVGEVVPRPTRELGHVHREAPATPYTFRDRYTDGYAAPIVVVDSGGGAFANARFHTPLTTTPT